MSLLEIVAFCGGAGWCAWQGVRGGAVVFGVLGLLRVKAVLGPRMHAKRAQQGRPRPYSEGGVQVAVPPGWTAKREPSEGERVSLEFEAPDAWVTVDYVPGGHVQPEAIDSWVETLRGHMRVHGRTPCSLAAAGFELTGARVTATKWKSGWVRELCLGSTAAGVLAVQVHRGLWTPPAVIERILASVELNETSTE